jgi:hypothetical protein
MVEIVKKPTLFLYKRKAHFTRKVGFPFAVFRAKNDVYTEGAAELF